MEWKKNLYVVWLSQLFSLMSFGFGLPFLPFYLETLGVSDPDTLKLYVGFLSIGPGLTMALMAPVWGRLADIYGRKMMILRAMGAGSIILLIMGLIRSPMGLLVLRTLQGAFTGTVTAANTFVAANTPKDKLSYAIGFLASASFLGYSIGPALGGFTGDLLGFRASFFIGASLMVIGFLLTFFLLKEDPSTYGRSEGPKVKMGIVYFLKIVGILLFMIMIQRFVRSIFTPYMPLYVQDLRGPENASTWTGIVNMCIGIATALAGITLTRLGDTKDKNVIITGLLIIGSVISFGLLKANTFTSFLILYTLMAFFLGGVEPLMTSLSAERVDPKNRGVLFGYQGMLSSFGFMIAPAVGTYVSIRYSYQFIFYVIIGTLLINLVFNIIDRRTHKHAS